MSKKSEKIYFGKIYRMEDPSHEGHFGMPFRANKKNKSYDVVKFTTSRKKSYKLIENIDPNSFKTSYVRKRPERVGETFIKKEMSNFRVQNTIDKKVLRKVRKNKIKIWNKKKK